MDMTHEIIQERVNHKTVFLSSLTNIKHFLQSEIHILHPIPKVAVYMTIALLHNETNSTISTNISLSK